MSDNIFKNNLKMLRVERGLGQVELSQKLGLSKGIISLWENGLREPSMTSLIMLAKFFNVSVENVVIRPNWEILSLFK